MLSGFVSAALLLRQRDCVGFSPNFLEWQTCAQFVAFNDIIKKILPFVNGIRAFIQPAPPVDHKTGENRYTAKHKHRPISNMPAMTPPMAGPNTSPKSIPM
jgi:hypothetical protein